MQAQAAQKPNGSRLKQIVKQRLRVPLRVLIFGAEGTGKSTLASGAPAPLWFDVEDGSAHLEVARYPFRDGPGGHVPHGYQEILAAIDDLATHDHGYQTLVIDTLDRLEALMWQWMIQRDAPSSKVKLTGIESYGYGRGYVAAVDEWRSLCLKLDRLRMAKGMSIVMLAHAQIRPFKNPLGDDFDRYNLRLNDKGAGFLKEWSDITGFACFEEGAASLGGERARGVSTGRRLLKLERTAAYDAKSRYALPAEVELNISNPWAPLADAIESALGMSSDVLTAAIAAECARIGDAETTAKVAKVVEEATKKNDTNALHRYLVGLKNRPAANTNQSKEETAP